MEIFSRMAVGLPPLTVLLLKKTRHQLQMWWQSSSLWLSSTPTGWPYVEEDGHGRGNGHRGGGRNGDSSNSTKQPGARTTGWRSRGNVAASFCQDDQKQPWHVRMTSCVPDLRRESTAWSTDSSSLGRKLNYGKLGWNAVSQTLMAVQSSFCL